MKTEKIMVKREKVNRFFLKIPTYIVTELDDPIYERAKVDIDEKDILQMNPNRNIKFRWERKLKDKQKKTTKTS